MSLREENKLENQGASGSMGSGGLETSEEEGIALYQLESAVYLMKRSKGQPVIEKGTQSLIEDKMKKRYNTPVDREPASRDIRREVVTCQEFRPRGFYSNIRSKILPRPVNKCWELKADFLNGRVVPEEKGVSLPNGIFIEWSNKRAANSMVARLETRPSSNRSTSEGFSNMGGLDQRGQKTLKNFLAQKGVRKSKPKKKKTSIKLTETSNDSGGGKLHSFKSQASPGSLESMSENEEKEQERVRNFIYYEHLYEGEHHKDEGSITSEEMEDIAWNKNLMPAHDFSEDWVDKLVEEDQNHRRKERRRVTWAQEDEVREITSTDLEEDPEYQWWKEDMGEEDEDELIRRDSSVDLPAAEGNLGSLETENWEELYKELVESRPIKETTGGNQERTIVTSSKQEQHSHAKTNTPHLRPISKSPRERQRSYRTSGHTNPFWPRPSFIRMVRIEGKLERSQEEVDQVELVRVIESLENEVLTEVKQECEWEWGVMSMRMEFEKGRVLEMDMQMKALLNDADYGLVDNDKIGFGQFQDQMALVPTIDPMDNCISVCFEHRAEPRSSRLYQDAAATRQHKNKGLRGLRQDKDSTKIKGQKSRRYRIKRLRTIRKKSRAVEQDRKAENSGKESIGVKKSPTKARSFISLNNKSIIKE
ncbi:hypothetical protein BY996DRAFT_6557945 [Phakopsora pachyrhizi]|nr:hypothetical protein BY996DRAFT_6557945 [Phakopsora pachyrhizi]